MSARRPSFVGGRSRRGFAQAAACLALRRAPGCSASTLARVHGAQVLCPALWPGGWLHPMSPRLAPHAGQRAPRRGVAMGRRGGCLAVWGRAVLQRGMSPRHPEAPGSPAYGTGPARAAAPFRPVPSRPAPRAARRTWLQPGALPVSHAPSHRMYPI